MPLDVLNDTLGAVTAVLAGVFATMLPLLLLTLNNPVALKGVVELLFRVSFSPAGELSVIHTLNCPIAGPAADADANNDRPMPPWFTNTGLACVPTDPSVATSDMLGPLIAVLPDVFATMLPLLLVTLNNPVALKDVVELLFRVSVSPVGELSVIHTLPCPDAVPFADANKDKPPAPLFTSKGLVADVPTDPPIATRDTLGAVTALLAGKFATMLPLPVVTLNNPVALKGVVRLLFRVRFSALGELSLIHTLPVPVPVAEANNDTPLPALLTSNGLGLELGLVGDVPIFPFVATKDTDGPVIAVLVGVRATMLPLVLVTLNNAVAPRAVVALFSVKVSGELELSVIHRLPCPDAVPVAEAYSDKPWPPLFTSTWLLLDVPISPLVATNDTFGAITAVLAGVFATMLPSALVTLKDTPALNGSSAVLFNVNVSAVVELSFIHRLPFPVVVPVAEANSSSPAPPLFTSRGLFAEVPIDPLAAINDALGAVTAVFAGVNATMLPLPLVKLNNTAALNDVVALFNVNASGVLELSFTHTLP